MEHKWFWNIAYFDKYYFDGIFHDFLFPDDTAPQWESVSWLQKRFMKWFNAERLRDTLTFPVETMNLLNDGNDYSDQEWFDFASEMYAEGHSFFTYTSNSVDSLASCCFSGEQMTLSKDSDGIKFMTFKELEKSQKRNFTIYHNGSWSQGKVVKLPGRKMYKITTVNNKTLCVTDNHLHPTLNGIKSTTDLNTDDYLLFNTATIDAVPEKDMHLTYEQGFLIGMYLGDGSIWDSTNCNSSTVSLSLNEIKYNSSIDTLHKALKQWDIEANINLGKSYNNVYPVCVHSAELASIIREFVKGRYCVEKELNMNCLLQNRDFRKGILDGFYLTDGGNSQRIYTTSEKLAIQMEALCSSLGINTIIDVSDRTDEPVIIRDQQYTRNYPLYCIRWYKDSNKRHMKDIWIKKNNDIYFKIKSIEPIESEEFVYCFEMKNQDEPYFTLPNNIITHNCRLRNELQDNTFSFTLGAGGVSTGSKGVITININRLVQNATKNDVDISDAVTEQIKKIHCYLKAFNEIMKDNFNAKLLPIYDAGFISLEKQFLTVGVNGFVEGAEFLGIPITPNEKYFDYCEKILKPIYDLNKAEKTRELMFNTEFVPAENLGVKNAKWDKEDGYFVPRDCYNSYFYIVEDEKTSLVDKFILHGNKLTKYLDGGSALHGNLNEHLSKEQYKVIMRDAVKTGCSYFTFNIPNTICNDCGHITKHRLDHCEKCGSKNIDYLTRVIGYLKRVSAFSEARQKEAAKRHYE